MFEPKKAFYLKKGCFLFFIALLFTLFNQSCVSTIALTKENRDKIRKVDTLSISFANDNFMIYKQNYQAGLGNFIDAITKGIAQALNAKTEEEAASIFNKRFKKILFSTLHDELNNSIKTNLTLTIDSIGPDKKADASFIFIIQHYGLGTSGMKGIFKLFKPQVEIEGILVMNPPFKYSFIPSKKYQGELELQVENITEHPIVWKKRVWLNPLYPRDNVKGATNFIEFLSDPALLEESLYETSKTIANDFIAKYKEEPQEGTYEQQ